jgi:hypothetical protein
MRKFVLVAPLFLVACASEPVVVRSTQYQVVMPQESMFNCPTVASFPDSRTLTDVQVARLIVQLYQNNTTCRNSMNTLRQFLENAKKTAEANNQEAD